MSDLYQFSETASVEPSFRYDDDKAICGRMELSQIIVENRARTDYGNLESLMESLATLGQLQSILVDLETNKLIAGGRRYAAMTKLGWTHANVIAVPSKGKAVDLMRELAENDDREGMNWLDKAKLIQRIHDFKHEENILQGKRWTMRQTGALFGLSHSKVSVVTNVLKAIEEGYTELTKCADVYEAYSKLLAHSEATATKQMSSIAKAAIEQKEKNAVKLVENLQKKLLPTGTSIEVNEPELTTKEEKKKEVDPFIEKAQSLVVQGDSLLSLMPALPPESFDHIFTDPPYGIETENMTGVVNIDETADEHNREENIEDFEKFLMQAYRVLRTKGFCGFFCDVEHIGTLLEISRDVGFSGQAWPLICRKEAAENKAALYNTPKNYECFMFVRKPGALLQHVVVDSVLDFKFQPGEKKKYIHPFAKPRDLCLKLLKMFASPNQRILDPYMGEGSLVTSIIAHGCIPVGFDKVQNHITRAIPHIVAELKKVKNVELFE